jgi:hypothetical protein
VYEQRSVAPEDSSVAEDGGADLARADKRIPVQLGSGVADHQP